VAALEEPVPETLAPASNGLEAASFSFAGGSASCGTGRQVLVAMYNRRLTKKTAKGGRKHPGHFTKRKKYRQCSSVVWLSKKSTRKLYIVRLLKHRRMVAPGDYINHKLQPVRKGSYTGLARGLAPRKTYKRYFRNKTSK
jgi:hypothetical protein